MGADPTNPADESERPAVSRYAGYHTHLNAGLGMFPGPAALRHHLVVAHDDEQARNMAWGLLPARHADHHG